MDQHVVVEIWIEILIRDAPPCYVDLTSNQIAVVLEPRVSETDGDRSDMHVSSVVSCLCTSDAATYAAFPTRGGAERRTEPEPGRFRFLSLVVDLRAKGVCL